MTIIEGLLVLAWVAVVLFWPPARKTGRPLAKPLAVLVTAIAAAALIVIF